MQQTPNLSCPECRAGDLITIAMNAGENDLSFTTCHMCEAKWWYKGGELVPLASVIGVVSTKS
jgi:DNA polymerase III alpha subunit (gram-positive type)